MITNKCLRHLIGAGVLFFTGCKDTAYFSPYGLGHGNPKLDYVVARGAELLAEHKQPKPAQILGDYYRVSCFSENMEAVYRVEAVPGSPFIEVSRRLKGITITRFSVSTEELEYLEELFRPIRGGENIKLWDDSASGLFLFIESRAGEQYFFGFANRIVDPDIRRLMNWLETKAERKR